MESFSTSREAKEFLIDKIVEQAQRDSVDLSEIERKTLYFSETHWSLPDIYKTNEVFEREYDQAEYEEKVANIIRGFYSWSRKHDSSARTKWKAAVRKLKTEDHYILVMIGMAEGGILPIANGSPTTSFARLLLIGLIASCILLPIGFIAMLVISHIRN